jgi:NAD(P)-dependent dehydrogenase (short-subunit alcohol dehydrogenase family)
MGDTVAPVLDGKVAIVTGAGRGVGRGVALALAKAGAAVAVLELDPVTGARTADEITALGGRAFAQVCDVKDPADCAAGVAATVEVFGGLDVLVNNAQQVRPFVRFEDVTDADMAACWESGPLASFRLMQLALPHFQSRGGGVVVNFGSGAGTEGMPGFAAYAAAKEATRGLTKVGAREWGRHGIRVNVLCPYAASEHWDSLSEEEQADRLRGVPLRRMGDPEADVGGVVVFLASDAGSYVTGQTIMVDGGTAGFR